MREVDWFEGKENKGRENRRFIIRERLIAIDGPDGVGKGTFSKVLLRMLREVHGKENVVLTSGTRFESTLAGCQLGEVVGRIQDSRMRNRLFLLSTRAIFRDIVIPALDEGKWVILDSSTLRHLAYTGSVYGFDSRVYRETQRWIENNKLDFGNQPAFRIILFASPEEILQNLLNRAFTDRGDPTDLKGVCERISAYRHAISFFESLLPKEKVAWLRLENPSLEKDRVEEGLTRLIRSHVLPFLTSA